MICSDFENFNINKMYKNNLHENSYFFKMANTLSGGTQTGDKPANISLSTEIRNYLLKVRNIENTKTLNLLKHKANNKNAENTRCYEK